MDMLRTEWRWFNNDILVADEGNRPVVLGVVGKRLAMRDERGVLIPFEPKSPIGNLVRSAPTMLSALEKAEEALLDQLEHCHTLLSQEAYDLVKAAVRLARGEQ